MFNPLITTLCTGKNYTEIARFLVKGRSLSLTFRVLEFGPESLKKASQVFFEHNFLPVDEIFVTAIHPSNAIFQHIEVPKVKSRKSLMDVAGFKAASQFTLPPNEVHIECLNSFKAIRNGLVPAFVILKTRFVNDFVSNLESLGFPEPDRISLRPLPIMSLAVDGVISSGSFFFFGVDIDFAFLAAFRDGEMVGVNFVDEGFSVLFDGQSLMEEEELFRLKMSFIEGSHLHYESYESDFSSSLEALIGYKIGMYLSNMISSSPNSERSDEKEFGHFFVLGQSSLSTRIYAQALRSILGGESTVEPLPLRVGDTMEISYTTAGLAFEGGEIVGKRKLVYKEEAQEQA